MVKYQFSITTLFSVLFLTFLFEANAFAVIDQDFVDYADFLRNQIIIEYKNRDKNFSQIERENLPYVEQLEVDPKIHRNVKTQNSLTVSYFLHGYLGSPHEMKYIAESALKSGHLVFNDLIFGHGYDGPMANKVSQQLFYKHAEKNLIFIFKHADKVQLTGFSTGGLIISTFINRHPEFLNKIEKLNLISPFYFSHIAIAPAFAHVLKVFIENVPTQTFYKYTSFPDVVAPLLEPKYFMQTIPVQSAIEIANLSDEFVSEAKIQNELLDTSIYLTENDQVLNFDKTLPFVKRIYPKAKVIELKNGKFPHHLMNPMVSDEAIVIKNNL